MLLSSLGSVLVFHDESLADTVRPGLSIRSLLLLLGFLFLDDDLLLLLPLVLLLPAVAPLTPLPLLLLLLFDDDDDVDSAFARTMNRDSDLSLRRNFGWK